MAEALTVAETSDRLGLHYMTVYRYIRTGQLPARRIGGRWLIETTDLAALSSESDARPRRGSRRRDLSVSLANRMLAGDSGGAWAIVEQMLMAGTPRDVYVSGLAPALKGIGDGWENGSLSIADEHRATAVALGLVGRLGPLFQRRGRRRPGRIVLAGAEGDTHSMPLAMVADVLRADGFDVLHLGADVPVDELASTVASVDGLRLVGLSAATDDSVQGLHMAVDRLRAIFPGTPILVGGPAVDAKNAMASQADGWAPDAAAALGEVHRLVTPSRNPQVVMAATSASPQ